MPKINKILEVYLSLDESLVGDDKIVWPSSFLTCCRDGGCWRSLKLTFNHQLIMEKDPNAINTRLRVLSDRIPWVLVFVYFCRGLSGNTEERPTRRVYIEILTCRTIFYHVEDSRSHGTEAEAERTQGQGARPPLLGTRPHQSPIRTLYRDIAPPT